VFGGRERAEKIVNFCGFAGLKKFWPSRDKQQATDENRPAKPFASGQPARIGRITR
jgi:hypothetical protein